MSVSRNAVIVAATALAQDTAEARLLHQDTDYFAAIDQALGIFQSHRPHRCVVHHTMTAAGFRVVLFGEGAVLTGNDAWVRGVSSLEAVWLGYDETAQGQAPLDVNAYRLVDAPGPKVVLELLEDTLADGEVLRLEFTRPHAFDADANASAGTTLQPADVTPFELLTASLICTMAATRYVQNLGTSAIPNDLVDRRSQSDVMKSRAKDLWNLYAQQVGIGAEGAGNGSAVAGYSVVRDLDVEASHGFGLFAHSRRFS